jgi:hypothetical protein
MFGSFARIPEPTYRDFVVEHLEQAHKTLEEMCERMLVDPEGRGVMVVLDSESLTRTYSLSEYVPWGHIFEFPSQDAVERWHDRGSPTS